MGGCIFLNLFGNPMKRILATILLCLIILLIYTRASAEPLYAGIQVDDDSVGILFGYSITKRYSVEAHYIRTNSSISHAGVTVDTLSTGIGIVGIALFPLKLNNVLPYSLFLKGGYQHTSSSETCSIPSSATLTLPYNNTIDSSKNQALFGGGAQLDLAKNLTGRMGLDFLGKQRSLYLTAIYSF